MHIIAENIVFGGKQIVYEHISKANDCPMQFAMFIPQKTTKDTPALIYLSGLTCTWENVMTKGGAQKLADEFGIIFIAPDTSPRGENIPDNETYDLGQGAGFYLNATQSPWNKNYQMYNYITKELITEITKLAPINPNKIGITGHSMGGHGALTIAIKNPNIFKSVSAFAPICAPTQCPWGQKALTAYLGNNQNSWQEYDTCELIKKYGWNNDILVDQGANDNFLQEQLMPQKLNQACNEQKIPLQLNIHKGYDHSYYFIASFLQNHFKWHKDRLN